MADLAGVTVEEALGVTEVARILGVHPQRNRKLQRIWRELTGLFTTENAVYWLTHPVPALEDRRPVELMAEEGGLDRVLETIGRMRWGVPT